MLSRSHGRAISWRVKARSLKKDRQGVASAVGTILALLVFLSLMALVVNTFVPAWMMDNERGHMNQVLDQFGGLKGKVDGMMLQWTIRRSPYGPMYAPISLGSPAVPLLASPTIGIMKTVPNGSAISAVQMTVTFGDPIAREEETIRGGGKIELYCPNRYYVQQWVAYENGAIILKQEDGQVMLAYPGMLIKKTSDGVQVHFTLIDLEGTGMIVSGSHSMGLNLEMRHASNRTYTGVGSWTLELKTEYGQAWRTYLDDALSQLDKDDYTIEPPDDESGVTTIRLTINDVDTLTVDRVVIGMTVVNS